MKEPKGKGGNKKRGGKRVSRKPGRSVSQFIKSYKGMQE
jgi:hypothetical protein